MSWFRAAVSQPSPGELRLVDDQPLQSDGELHVTAAHHVLDLELHEPCLQTQRQTDIGSSNCIPLPRLMGGGG